LIDFERLRDRSMGESNVDMVSFFKQVLLEMRPLMTQGQRDYLTETSMVDNATLTAANIVIVLENLLKISPL
jgi:hypothetical protein